MSEVLDQTQYWAELIHKWSFYLTLALIAVMAFIRMSRPND